MEIPPPGGGGRTLGLPTGLDRFGPQAGQPGLQPRWDRTVAEGREGCRPGRAAPQAVAPAQRDVRAGDSWVVDLALEPGVDRGNQDTLRSLVKERGAERRVRQRSDRDLKAGALTDEGVAATVEGTPPGGPVSPR